MLKCIKIFKKIIYIFLFFLLLFLILSRGHTYKTEDLEFGVTFSKKQAENLGLDWKQTYSNIFEELKVKKIRLSAYWNEVECAQENFTWDDLDWQIQKASEAHAEIILAVGGRLPRWPECHFPAWTADISGEQKDAELLEYIEAVIKRYQGNKNIIAWQVENEPFLINFGECPKLDKELLDREIALVRALDNRQIIITDSGELSAWLPAAKRADIFGTTMYL